MSNRVKVKEAFEKIHADDELKKSTKEFLFQKTKGYRKSRFFPYNRTAMIMACFLIVMLGQKGYSAYFTSVSTISIDVNPSIELSVNRFDKVIFVETYSEDGDAILSSINIRFQDYNNALEQILANKGMAQYLTQDQVIAITVFGTDEKKCDEMLANLTDCTVSYENVHCSSASSEEVAAAHSVGMSFGKYKAFLELQALDSTIMPEDVKGLTMRQIRDMINELSSGMEDAIRNDDTDRRNGGRSFKHGNGHENGNGNGSGWYQTK